MNMLGIVFTIGIVIAVVFTIGIVIAGGFLIWLYTKPGKRWLKNL